MPPSTEQKAAIFAPSKFKKKVFSPERSRDVKNKAGIGLSSGETLTRPERGQHAVTEALIQKLQSSQEAFAKDPIGCFLLSFYCFSLDILGNTKCYEGIKIILTFIKIRSKLKTKNISNNLFCLN